MNGHEFVPDKTVSIVRGLPLSEEAGLGKLTLSGFLREVTGRFPGREALVQRRADGTMKRWSYQELWERSAAVAKSLVALDLGKGERVGVLMTNRAEFLAAVFGTALAGGVAATLSTFSTPHELEHLIAGSACSMLLMERQVLKKNFAEILCELEPAIGAANAGGIVSDKFPFLRHIAMVDGDAAVGAIEPWNAFLARGAGIADWRVEARAATVSPADPGVLFFSSGSTSKPKGTLSAHRGVTIQL